MTETAREKIAEEIEAYCPHSNEWEREGAFRAILAALPDIIADMVKPMEEFFVRDNGRCVLQCNLPGAVYLVNRNSDDTFCAAGEGTGRKVASGCSRGEAIKAAHDDVTAQILKQLGLG